MRSRKTKSVSPARRRRPTVKQLLAIGKRFRKHLKGPIIDHAEFLYDEKGLPK